MKDNVPAAPGPSATDIVERLDKRADEMRDWGVGCGRQEEEQLLRDAKAEIERLRHPLTPTEDSFVNAVHCLIFSMVERGASGADPWWGQDFLHVKQLLEARGLNCDPTAALSSALGAAPTTEKKDAL